MSQVSTIKYFFGDGGPTKSIKVNKSLSFLKEDGGGQMKDYLGFIYLKIYREKLIFTIYF